jgi:hypothetical protein
VRAERAARVGAAFRRGGGPLELSIGGELSLGGRDEIWVEAGARWRYPIGWVLPYAGVEVGAALVQVLDSNGPAQTRRSLAVDALGALGTEIGVAPRVALRIEGLAGWIAPGIDAGLEVRAAFIVRGALGWRW